MKCPKCHYLSFDPEPRCRNCGFTLALDEIDLPIVAERRDDESGGVRETMSDDQPDEDLFLAKETTTASGAAPVLDPALREVRRSEPTRKLPAGRAPAATASGSADPRPVVTTELPLFVKEVAPETEPVTETPREPVFEPAKPTPVIRSAAPVTRERRPPTRKLGPLDDDLLDVLNRIDRREGIRPAVVRDLSDGAGHIRRLGAAMVDALLIGALSTTVVAVTLRWCGLGWTDWAALPRLPIGAFLLMILLGYLLLFTSIGGQTLGKMVFRIRVVDAGETGADALDLGAGQALYREIIAVPSTLAFGLGFLPALFGEGRAVHDRLASTRVIRA